MDLDGTTTWGSFVQSISSLTDVPCSQLRILSGFPPRPVEVGDGAASIASVLPGGGNVIVQVGEADVVKGKTEGRYVPPVDGKWHFVRRVCPSDNSCLFHAAAYVLRNKSRVDGPSLRKECADIVQAYPNVFNEKTILDRPNREYVDFIRNPNAWGGAIELMVLSFLTQTEIVALDLTSSNVLHFGEDNNYTVRAYVVFNGQHYDAIAMNPMFNSPQESEDQVLFSSTDAEVLNRARRFVADEAKKLRLR